jgi:hypothetical protein
VVVVVKSMKEVVRVMRSVEGGLVERESKRLGCFADAGEGEKPRSEKLSHVLTVVASVLYAGGYLCSENGRGLRNGSAGL